MLKESQVSIIDTSYPISRDSRSQSEVSLFSDNGSQAKSPRCEDESCSSFEESSLSLSGFSLQEKCDRITSNLVETYRNFSLLGVEFAQYQELVTWWKHSQDNARLLSPNLHYSEDKRKKSPTEEVKLPPGEVPSGNPSVSKSRRQDQSVQTETLVASGAKINPTLATTTPAMNSQPLETLISHITGLKLALDRVVQHLKQLNTDKLDRSQAESARHVKQITYLSSLEATTDQMKKLLRKNESHLEDMDLNLLEFQTAHLKSLDTQFASVHCKLDDLCQLQSNCTARTPEEKNEICRQVQEATTAALHKYSSVSPPKAEEHQSTILVPQINFKYLPQAGPPRRKRKGISLIRKHTRLIKSLQAECQALQIAVEERNARVWVLEQDLDRQRDFSGQIQDLLMKVTSQRTFSPPHDPPCQCQARDRSEEDLGKEISKANQAQASVSKQLIVTLRQLIQFHTDLDDRQTTQVAKDRQITEDLKVLLSQEELLRKTWELSGVNSGQRLLALHRCYQHLLRRHLLLRRRYLQLNLRSKEKLRLYRKQFQKLCHSRTLRWKRLRQQSLALQDHYKVLMSSLGDKVMYLVELLDSGGIGNITSKGEDKKNMSAEWEKQNLTTCYNGVALRLDWVVPAFFALQ